MAAQNLVPKGLPYGERQQAVDSRRRAGLALDPSPPPPSAPMPAGAPSPQGQARPTPPRFDPLLETSPDMFPTVGNPQAASPIASPLQMTAKDAFANMAARSQSSLMRTVAARLAAQR